MTACLLNRSRSDTPPPMHCASGYDWRRDQPNDDERDSEATAQGCRKRSSVSQSAARGAMRAAALIGGLPVGGDGTTGAKNRRNRDEAPPNRNQLPGSVRSTDRL